MWELFRRHDMNFLEDALNDIAPPDHIIEQFKKITWWHWNSSYEAASAQIIATSVGYFPVSSWEKDPENNLGRLHWTRSGA